MNQVTRKFHCQNCAHTFERIVLESVVTAACPQCRPFVALLERLGLTPEQAITLTLVGVGVAFLARE